MSSENNLAKTTLVLVLFASILLLTYFWPIPIHATDLRNLTPDPFKADIDSYLEKYTPEERAALLVPPPEVVREVNSTLNDLVVTQGELNATHWITANTKDSDRFVADIFGAELIMGMTTRASTEGGDWANAPDPIKMMTDTNEVFITKDPARVHELARALNATYVFVPQQRRLNTGWWVTPAEVGKDKFEDARYFEKVYSNEDVAVYKVL